MHLVSTLGEILLNAFPSFLLFASFQFFLSSHLLLQERYLVINLGNILLEAVLPFIALALPRVGKTTQEQAAASCSLLGAGPGCST